MVGHLLTEEMVEGFNNVLKSEESILEVVFGGTCGYIKFTPDRYISENSTPVLTDEFYLKVGDYFKNQHDLSNISYNNTRTTFWIIG